jgi:hypothetical protein
MQTLCYDDLNSVEYEDIEIEELQKKCGSGTN